MTPAAAEQPLELELVIRGVRFSLSSNHNEGGSLAVTHSQGQTCVNFTNYTGTLQIHSVPPSHLLQATTSPAALEDSQEQNDETLDKSESEPKQCSTNSQPAEDVSQEDSLSKQSRLGHITHDNVRKQQCDDHESDRNSLDSFSEQPLHTVESKLHLACADPDASLEQLRAVLQENPSAASKIDKGGQCPLHILSENEALLSTETGREVARLFALELLEAYPKAMLTVDASDHVPFIMPLERWVDRTYRLAHSKTPSNRSNNVLVRTLSRINSSFHGGEHGLDGDHTMEAGDTNDTASSRLGLRWLFRHSSESFLSRKVMTHYPDRDTSIGGPGAYKLCPYVGVPPKIEWIFSMLSTILIQANEQLTNPNSKRQDVILVWSSVMTSLTSIPYLLKTIFLIESEETRIRILRQPVVQRLLLSPETVGRWICLMLHRRGFASQRAVDYFVEVSKVTVYAYVGPERTPRSEDIVEFDDRRLEVFTAVAGISSVIPSLAVLDQKETERAAATDVIWHTVSLSMSRPIVVGILAVDLLFHIVLMFVVRFDVSHQDFDLLEEFSPSFRDNASKGLIGSICIYFILRKISEVFSLLRISNRALKAYTFDLWNVIDMGAIALSLISAFVTGNYPWLFAITSAALWLKLLGNLKAINMEFATFILAIIEIMKDIKWFLVVLSIFIFMFGDMIHILTTRSPANYCAADLPPPQFCSTTAVSPAYLKLYAVIVGDVSLEDFSYNPGISFLFCIFMLYGFIILLNVLIAIVSDSYEKSVIRAKFLFGRARVGFAVTHVAQEQFLQGTEREVPFEGIQTFCNHDFVLWLVGFIGRWFMLAFMVWTFVLTEIYMIALAIEAPSQGSMGLFVASKILSAVLSIVLFVAMTLILQNLFQESLDRFAARLRLTGVRNSVNGVLQWVLQIITEQMLGIHQSTGLVERKGWQGKFEFLEDTLYKIVCKTEKHVLDNMLASEQRIKTDINAHTTAQVMQGRETR